MRQIYLLEETDDGEIIKLIDILSIYEISKFHKKGYLLAHHIVEANNKTLLKYFVKKNIGKLETFLTQNYIFNTNGIKISIPSNQTMLHISASNSNLEIYNRLRKVIPDTPDILDLYAEDYLKNKNNLDFLKKNNNKMLNNFGIKWDINEIIVDKYSNKIREKIIDYIKKNNIIKPNSMHKFDHVLDNFEFINELILDLNQKFNLGLENKTYEVSTFTAEYGPETSNNLDLHKDNSIITISWNLDIEPETIGTEIVYPTIGKEIKITSSMLLIHHGKLEHYVKPLLQGSRTNLIIWIK